MSEVKWRDLALQFDGHRMEAISLLKMIINDASEDQYLSVRNFLKAAPLSGEDVLRNRIEEIAENMQQQLTPTTNSLTNAQEALKSAGIEADTVQAGVMELLSRMNQVVAENKVLDDALGAIADAYETGMADLLAKEIDTAINIETPSTDAYLNAVRADAVVEAFVTVFDVCSRDDHIDENLWNYGVLRVEKHADEYVNQLRAGNAGKNGSHE